MLGVWADVSVEEGTALPQAAGQASPWKQAQRRHAGGRRRELGNWGQK